LAVCLRKDQTLVTISDDVEEKLVRIMLNHGLESLGEAIEYAADENVGTRGRNNRTGTRSDVV
jgi:hypothetical protein